MEQRNTGKIDEFESRQEQLKEAARNSSDLTKYPRDFSCPRCGQSYLGHDYVLCNAGYKEWEDKQ